MIIQCFPLQETDPGYSTMYNGRIESYFPPGIQQFAYGNQLYWRRKHLWKLVERIDKSFIVEHICIIDPVSKLVIPLLSRFMKDSTIRVYSHSYKAAIDYFNSVNMTRSGTSTTPINIGLLPFIHASNQQSGYFKLSDYIDDWFKKNPDIMSISPVREFPIDRTRENDQLIYPNTGYYTGELYGTNNKIFYSSDLPSGADMKSTAIDMSSILTEAYRDVKQGNYPEGLLTDLLIDYFAPWKCQWYNMSNSVPQLSMMKDFCEGRMTISALSRFLGPGALIPDVAYIVPNENHIPAVSDYTNTHFKEIAIYTKELASLIEYIQSINLTDFCVKFKLSDLSLSVFNGDVIFDNNRYFPAENKYGFKFPYVTTSKNLDDYKYLDYVSELGDLLADWLVVCESDVLDRFKNLDTTITVFRTFSEELFITFDVPFHADKHVIYHDLTAGLVCGRNMCNLQIQNTTMATNMLAC